MYMLVCRESAVTHVNDQGLKNLYESDSEVYTVRLHCSNLACLTSVVCH